MEEDISINIKSLHVRYLHFLSQKCLPFIFTSYKKKSTLFFPLSSFLSGPLFHCILPMYIPPSIPPFFPPLSLHLISSILLPVISSIPPFPPLPSCDLPFPPAIPHSLQLPSLVPSHFPPPFLPFWTLPSSLLPPSYLLPCPAQLSRHGRPKYRVVKENVE